MKYCASFKKQMLLVAGNSTFDSKQKFAPTWKLGKVTTEQAKAAVSFGKKQVGSLLTLWLVRTAKACLTIPLNWGWVSKFENGTSMVERDNKTNRRNTTIRGTISAQQNIYLTVH